MSFDLPERSPLATLSIIDMSSSQVTCPRGHGGSWLLWPCLKHPPAQKSEDFRGRVGPRSVFCTEQPRVLQGSAQHQPGPFGLFKIQAPFLVKPCTLGTPPSPLGHCVTVEVSRVVQSWIRPGGFPDPGLAGLGQGTQLGRGGGSRMGGRGEQAGTAVAGAGNPQPSCPFPITEGHLPLAVAGAARQPGGQSQRFAVDPGRGGADPRLWGRHCLRTPVLLLCNEGT